MTLPLLTLTALGGLGSAMVWASLRRFPRPPAHPHQRTENHRE